jgi:hypothetical protein
MGDSFGNSSTHREDNRNRLLLDAAYDHNDVSSPARSVHAALLALRDTWVDNRQDPSMNAFYGANHLGV